MKTPRLTIVESLEARRLLSGGTGDAGHVLFIRGADRSGGFLEANNDTGRTEQLADITNDQTFGGNHGWGELATALETHGYELTQLAETIESGASATGQVDGVHLDLETLDLAQYDVVVFGSNNAVYDQAAVDAFELFVRNGGGTLFISDANFGSSWGDAPASDQPFLDVIGWQMNQDRGTYSLLRGDGDFVVPDHPIFTNVDRFDGEGVSPVNLANATVGQRLSIAKGDTSDNTGDNRGPARAVTGDDASLAAAEVQGGRVVAHFDRNTFFNANGAGTNINRFDNEQYALNLFDYLAGRIGDERSPVGVGSYDGEASQTIAFSFDEDVASSVDANDVVVTNLTTGQTFDAFTFDRTDFGRGITLTATTLLPDGRYEARISAADATDEAGNTLAGDVVVTFDVLAGDANGDGSVSILDFAALRANFGSGSLFSQGDFNYDGTVSILDFAVLRGNFGATLDDDESL